MPTRELIPETDDMAAEWARIEMLAELLADSRQGKDPVPEELERLRGIQARVERGRADSQIWEVLSNPPLSSLERDILACAVAPEAEPRIGWLFQSLQLGAPQPYPTPALIRELLALSPDEVPFLDEALRESGSLRRANLIQADGNGPYQPILPTSAASGRLLNRRANSVVLPGAVKIHIEARWEDLVLPVDRLAMLQEFLLWIHHRDTVVNQWGGVDCGGPVALFSGPSGTGKTFAASVMANELGWPLYRVDLGRLVSKYIGETEKNLNRLFDAAHGQDMILQFDEADSLFSKRGEVKDARDRYANMEVSHLLARIENHRGAVILTTNLRKHLDPAFARRFQVVVDFPRPDAHARTRLWERLIPPRAPRLPDVDPAFLGKAVNLTGGSIRNAALHAAYLAAGDGSPVNLSHLALAVWREIGKDGRELSISDLGPMAPYFPGEDSC